MPPSIKLGILLSVIVAAATIHAPTNAAPLSLDSSYSVEGDDLGTSKGINIHIPVNDANQPAYGGMLRYHDVAIAQAVAIARKSCSTRYEQGFEFFLTSGTSERTKIGKFYIACSLAHDLVSAYGLNEDVVRPVKGYAGATEYFPSLNLNTDAKTRRFISFSSNFEPVAWGWE